MIRTIIADDQAVVRAGLRLILQAHDDIDLVGEAENGAQAVDLTRETRPDVALIDIRMPILDGIEATRRIAAQGAPTRVLILTTYGLDQYVYDALKAGAAGFLLKTEDPERLVAGIRTVANGDALLAPDITARLIERFLAAPPPDIQIPDAVNQLTQRELEVLQHIARGQSNAEIATDLYVSEGTVKTHVTRILTKLGLRDRVQAVVYAYEHQLTQPGKH